MFRQAFGHLDDPNRPISDALPRSTSTDHGAISDGHKLDKIECLLLRIQGMIPWWIPRNETANASWHLIKVPKSPNLNRDSITYEY